MGCKLFVAILITMSMIVGNRAEDITEMATDQEDAEVFDSVSTFIHQRDGETDNLKTSIYDIKNTLKKILELTAPDYLPVRLVQGKSSTEGLVEVNNKGVWGSVCFAEFYDKDAEVVCRTLGHKGGKAKGTMSSSEAGIFGKSSSQNWISRLGCTGEEAHLGKCDIRWDPRHNNCPATATAGVICA